MKKLLLVLLFISSSLSAQELVWQSYTEPGGDLSYSIRFYSDGSISTQGVSNCICGLCLYSNIKGPSIWKGIF